MKAPTQCILWTKPELIDAPLEQLFERLATFVDESHWWRYLLKCRECGQLYFFEFYEEIDWVNSNDGQYVTYIPVETSDEIDALSKTSPLELLHFSPRLQKDVPKGTVKPRLQWICRS